MDLLLFAFFLWILPIIVCCYISNEQGKSVEKTFLLAALFSWLGGVLAIVMLEKEDSKAAAQEADLQRQRDEANLRALGQLPRAPGELSDSRKRELEKYYGGSKKS